MNYMTYEDFLPKGTMQVLEKFGSVLSRMQSSKRENLLIGISQMRKFGVDGYSKRIIDKNGYSSMFCTSVNWAAIDKDNNFMDDFVNHNSVELIKMKKQCWGLVTRSKDKVFTPFLRRLEDTGVNNSVISMEFVNNQIEITYFMADPAFPEYRDKIINNLRKLKSIEERIKPSLREIIISEDFKRDRHKFLNHDATRAIWGPSDNSVIKTNNEYSLSFREIECLDFLKFGSSNVFIAKKLCISVETVKYHIQNIKSKFDLETRDELVKFASKCRLGG